MVWTKEAPTKPGKYIIRYMDETTGRMHYGTYVVYKSGMYGYTYDGNVRKGCKPPVYAPTEYSKRVEDVE